MFTLITSALVLSLLPLTLTKDIPITVGANAALRFSPEVVTAAVGDTLSFSYFPRNHSVVQSNFANPCAPLAGGFFSGFVPLAAGPGPQKFIVTVKNTQPIWVYCAQTTGRHCQQGMSMVVNQPAPPSPNTLVAYKAAANSTNSTAPSAISGGVFVSTNGTSGSPSASASGRGASPTGGAGGSGTGSGTGSSSPVPFKPGSAAAASAVVSGFLVVAGVCTFGFSLI